MARDLPTGTITFLFSDIAGSTRLVAELGPARFTDLLERHNGLLRATFAEHGGTERGTQGDSFLVMFRDAPAALAAAADAQRALAPEPWPADAAVAVRLGVHTGIARLGGDDYVGLDVHRAARIAGAAHGGQVVVSDATRALAVADLPPGVTLRPLGEHALRDLGRPEPLHQLVIEGLPADFPPLRTASAARHDLPERLTSFVGRDRELAELAALLATSRLVTLTGPGGTGKTSLAVELARAHAGDFAHGAHWVPLESVADPDRVEGTIATRLGFVGPAAVRPRLAEALADRELLLVLDNFEQVVAAADLVGEILRGATGVWIVVTSRAPLHLSMEQAYPVEPLALPGPVDPLEAAMASPAMRLFVERAARVRPDYRLTEADAAAVADVCRRLDGLPLGIELAASRIGLLSPAQIADRLARRIELPGTGSRDLPERQRSLTAAIAWSHDLLEPGDRRLLARLAVFAGGCRVEEAELVAGEPGGPGVLDGLARLADQGLVRPEPGRDGTRFRMLETIRAFAAQRLEASGEAGRVRREHALAYLGVAETIAPSLPGRGQAALLDRLEADHDNLRAAIRWAIDAGEADLGLRFAAATWRFWQIRGHLTEGLALVDEVFALPGAEARTASRLRALEGAGGLRWWSGDIRAAGERYAEEVELGRELEHAAGLADGLFNLAHVDLAAGGGEATAVPAMLDEAEALYAALGDQRSVARIGWIRANREFLAGDLDGARTAAESLIARFEALEDDFYLGLATLALSQMELAAGDIAGALRRAIVGIRAQQRLGDIASCVFALRAAAIVLAGVADRPEEAAMIDGAYEALRRRHGLAVPVDPTTWSPFMTRDHAILAVLADPRYRRAAERGATLSLDEALDLLEQVAAEVIAEAPPAAPATTPPQPG